MISRHTTLLVLLCVTWLVRPVPVVAQDAEKAPEALPAITLPAARVANCAHGNDTR